jgi:septum site-determining protein MinC
MNSVVIKGNKYGIVLKMDPQTEFEQLKADIADKFKEAGKFFQDAKMAISFEGRTLTEEEEREVLDVISKNSEVNIVCIIDSDSIKEQYFKKTVEEKLAELSSHTGQFYKGTLRSGQIIESENSIIVLGDVNPGAKVISKGNVVVLGSLKGTVYAGGAGNSSAFVVALEMDPMQIRIGDVIARSSDSPKKNAESDKQPKIAFVEDENIYIELLCKDVIQDLPV